MRAGRIRFCGEIRYFMGYGRCGRCGKPGRPRTGGFKFFLIFVADSVWRPSFFCLEAADSCRLACGRQFLIFARRNALFPGISSECGGICRGACGSGCICDFIAPCPFYRTLTTVPGTLPPASENYNEKINDSAYETKENAFIHALPARAVFPPGAARDLLPRPMRAAMPGSSGPGSKSSSPGMRRRRARRRNRSAC